MAGFSRQKGARGEREVIELLQPVLDEVCDTCGQPRIELRRNWDQRWRKKQYDVIGLPWIALEVKRQENLSGIEGWWRQVEEACLEGQVPVLLYRKNHAPWRARLRANLVAGELNDVEIVADLGLDDFLHWLHWFLIEKLEVRR